MSVHLCVATLLSFCVFAAARIDDSEYDGPLWHHPELRRVPAPVHTEDGTRVYSHHYEARNPRTDAYTVLSYEVGLPKHVIPFDEEYGVESIRCMDHHIEVFARTEYLQKALRWAENSRFNGGPRWGCKNEDGEETAFFRVATSAPQLSRAGNSVLVDTVDILPWDFFGPSQVRFFSNDTFEDKETMEARFAARGENSQAPRFSWPSIPNPLEGRTDLWPGGDSKWGYGLGASLIDWQPGTTQLKLVDAGPLQVVCQDCHAEASLGAGFEFETYFKPTSLDLKLKYLQLWVSGALDFSVNLNATASGAFHAGGNYWANPEDSKAQRFNQDIVTKNPGKSPKVLKKDFTFSVGPVVVMLNFRIPTYLRWELDGKVAGHFYGGAYFKLKGKFGIAYVTSDCTAARCKEAKQASTCATAAKSSGWCYIIEKDFGYGGNGPSYDFQGQATAKMWLTPVINLELYGGLLSSYSMVDPYIQIAGQLPCPGLPSNAPSVKISVTMGAQAQLWGGVKLAVDFKLAKYTLMESYTPRYTVFTWTLASPIFSACIDLKAIAQKLIPAKAKRMLEQAAGGVLDLLNRVQVNVPGGALANAAQEIVAQLETLPPPQLFTPAQQEKFSVIGDIVAMMPHGTTFSKDVAITLPFDKTLVAECAQLLFVKATSTDKLDWTALAQTAITKCDLVNGIATANVRSFSLYTTAAQPPSPPTFSPSPGSYNTGPVKVTLAATFNGAACQSCEMHYTLDGSDPSMTATKYTGPISLPLGATVVKAISHIANGTSSPVAAGQFLLAADGAVHLVDISPYQGTFVEVVNVTMACASAGVDIFYTVDGSTPTPASIKYTGPFLLTQYGALTISALARGGTSRSVQVTVLEQVGTPVLSPASGVFENQVTLQVSNPKTTGATYLYTTDGLDPVGSSELFPSSSGLVHQAIGTTEYRVVATKTGLAPSAVVSGTYTITARAATPVINPPAGTFVDSVTLAASCATPGATLFYTLNGVDPTSSDAVVDSSAGIVLSTVGVFTVKVMASAPLYNNSLPVTATIKIWEQVKTPSVSPASSDGIESYDAVSVSLATATANATVYYTTDGSIPTSSSSVYSAPFNLTAPNCYRVVALATKYDHADSFPAAVTIVILDRSKAQQQVSTPEFEPNGGEYTDGVLVQVSQCTPNATIHYDVTAPDGSKQSDLIYSMPINVSTLGTTTIEVHSERVGWISSAHAVAQFTIVPPKKQPVVRVVVVMNKPLSALTLSDWEMTNFKNQLRANIASALTIDINRVSITSIVGQTDNPSRIVVDITIQPDYTTTDPRTQQQLQAELEAQVNDPNSVLRQGEVSSLIVELHAETVDDEEESHGLSAGVIAGIVIACVVFVAALVAGALLLVRHRRSRPLESDTQLAVLESSAHEL